MLSSNRRREINKGSSGLEQAIVKCQHELVSNRDPIAARNERQTAISWPERKGINKLEKSILGGSAHQGSDRLI